MKGLRALVAVVVAVSASAPAWAQQAHDPVAAEALFREGRAAADAGNFVAACPKFKASYGFDPAPGTLFNLADCEERVGQLAAAWQHFHQLLDQLSASDDRRPYVQTHSQQLEARVPRLRVVLAAGAPPGTKVVRDGEPLAAALIGVAVPVDPGAHRVVVRAADRVDQVYELTLAEKDQQDVEVTVGPAVPHAAAPPKPVVVRVPPPKRASPLRTVGFVVGGVGLVSAAAGAVFGGLALADNGKSNASCTGSVCSSQQAIDLHERAKTEALVADIAIFGGVALVATGAVFLLLSRRHTEVQVVPAAGPTGAGLSLMGAF